MPQDADDERLVGILDPLDGAVLGPGDLTEAFADSIDALVVMRHDRAANLADARRGIDANRVLRELPEYLAVLLVPHDLGQVLDDVAAPGDVEHLEATADREHRQLACERGLEQRELAAVALRVRARRLRMRVRAVPGGLRGVPAGKDGAGDPGEPLADPVRGGRHEPRPASRPLDGAEVAVGDERGLDLPPVGP